MRLIPWRIVQHTVRRIHIHISNSLNSNYNSFFISISLIMMSNKCLWKTKSFSRSLWDQFYLIAMPLFLFPMKRDYSISSMWLILMSNGLIYKENSSTVKWQCDAAIIFILFRRFFKWNRNLFLSRTILIGGVAA